MAEELTSGLAAEEGGDRLRAAEVYRILAISAYRAGAVSSAKIYFRLSTKTAPDSWIEVLGHPILSQLFDD
ncbi:hypothetical protein [Luteolibacter soli]|uniref:Uncharacterized protein n=1 Tax=Luteolibacter soli TaxID=3135280 RepID=A0ABU9B360_9BACT